MPAEQYAGFIREVYLDPIRSVLIVDDDYPTLEELIGGEKKSLGATANGEDARPRFKKRWHDMKPEVRAVISGFHKATPPMIVDVHDGQNVTPEGEEQTIEHLHQSDLLVLDFELDRAREGDGTRAIEILRTVLANQQFNLVALHTRDDLNKVFFDVLFGLLSPAAVLLTDEEREACKNWIAATEEKTGDFEIEADLGKTLQREHYAHYRLKSEWTPSPQAPSLATFDDFCKRHNVTNEAQKDMLFRKALDLVERGVRAGMAETTPSNMAWSSAEPRWIRCDEGFIAFTQKGVGADLTNEVQKALVAWAPPPSRLFWAKLRGELDRAGFTAEAKALANQRVLATWYRRLFAQKGAARDFLVAESVGRHAEMLIAEVLPEVKKFAHRLVDADEGDDPVALCKTYFGVDLGDRATNELASSEHNVFVCSKPYEGYHLATGHIFRADGHYWVCLTPMCDLVPDRREYSSVGGAMPFIAVRLKVADVQRPAEQILSGRVAMIKVGAAIKSIMMGQASESSSPEWFTLYAGNQGRFDDGKFQLYRLAPGGNLNGTAENAPRGDEVKAADPVKEDLPVKVEVIEAEIITQLRYEYALSMMHKLGGNLTRVGLDFLGRG
jgi:CheY-like chemotaxis protein